MIIVELTGGLGNQMFQYAYGRSESIKKDQPLKYYFIHNHEDTNRQYELNIFNLKGKKINNFIPRIFRRINHLIGMNVPNFDCGYWQNEKYFIKYENEIRKDFQFKKPLDKKNNKVLEEIKNTNSVSVHIRRGDYITNRKASYYLGVCSISYYHKAIKLIQKKVSKAKFFIFSDEPGWAKENLRVNGVIYIDWNIGINNFKDMQLMSNCKHNIIANSSFSWWAAWLNENPKKIVIAPRKWYKNEKYRNNTAIPKNWLSV